MKFRSLFCNPKIIFKVDGKPPQKSEWGGKNADLVIKLREAALQARNKSGFDQCFTTPIKLSITIHVPDYSQLIIDDPKLHVGDLDSLVAGVCDYLHKGPKKGENKFELSSLFDSKPEIGPDIPLIIDDDSKITNIIAEKKVTKGKTFYEVEIELLKHSSTIQHNVE